MKVKISDLLRAAEGQLISECRKLRPLSSTSVAWLMPTTRESSGTTTSNPACPTIKMLSTQWPESWAENRRIVCGYGVVGELECGADESKGVGAARQGQLLGALDVVALAGGGVRHELPAQTAASDSAEEWLLREERQFEEAGRLGLGRTWP